MSDYDESTKQAIEKHTRKEMERLKALEDNKNALPIKLFDDLAKGATRKIFDDDDDLFSDEPVNLNHLINAQSEGIMVQA